MGKRFLGVVSNSRSICHLVVLFPPRLERPQGLVAAEGRRGQVAGRGRQRQFAVDKGIVEACRRRIVLRGGIEEAAQPCPVNRAQTHGARLARGVDVAAREVKSVQLRRCGTDGLHLGVRRGVVVGCHAIHALGNHLAAARNHRSERAAPVAHVLHGQVNGPLHQFLLCHKPKMNNYRAKITDSRQCAKRCGPKSP